MVLSVEPVIDNTKFKLSETYKKIIRESEEIRLATGYFYLSGFNLYKEDLENLADPEKLGRAPFKIIMSSETDRRTAEEIDEGVTLRDVFKENIKEDINNLNNAQIERLDRLKDFIAKGIVDIRLRIPEEGNFHAKGASFRMYSDEEHDPNDDEDRRPSMTIVGSSNFSKTGHTKNIELNLTSHERSKAVAFEKWFDNQWANSEEYSKELIKIIESQEKYRQWKESQEEELEDEEIELGTYIEPFELYKLLAYDALDGNISERYDSPLYHFQKIGYESARAKIAKYNGVIISDSVGLGKSFIGAELLRDFRNLSKNCLLVVPANTIDQWENLLKNDTDEYGNPFFNLEVDDTHLKIMSITQFQNLSYSEVLEYGDIFDVVLIDEAHRFRSHGQWRINPSDKDDYEGTRRHANMRLLRGKTMIMLTATPVNNSAEDLKNIISLFTGENELRNKAGRDFDAFTNYIKLSTKRKKILSGKLKDTEGNIQSIKDELTSLAVEISKILDEVMVLRTRKHVKDNLTENEEIEINFNPPTIHKEEYELPEGYRPAFDLLPEVMDALHFPHIVIKNPKSGFTLKALYKLNLLKRLESSTYAFIKSLETIYNSETSLLKYLDKLDESVKIDDLRTKRDKNDNKALSDFVENEEIEEDIRETLDEFGFESTNLDGDTDGYALMDTTVKDVKDFIREDLVLLSYFVSQFIKETRKKDTDIDVKILALKSWLEEKGLDRIPTVYEEDERFYPDVDLSDAIEMTKDFYKTIFEFDEFDDPKLDCLVDIINSVGNEKLLLFTQYRATADYVYNTLLSREDSPLNNVNSEVVKGGDYNKREIIQRFSPESTGYQKQLEETEETELTYVVSTDTLSEGVNLQDIHVVVNYDLPWNPMRIVQRVGRIDRIGSVEDKNVHNFFPDSDLEAAIKLLTRLQAKITDIALIVGKENNILDPNEDAIMGTQELGRTGTIGELEIEEIKHRIAQTREADDYNELDDVSLNPLLQNAGLDMDEAFERLMLKIQLKNYDLTVEDFEFAEEYFNEPPDERELLYTHLDYEEGRPSPGLFGLNHIWFKNSDKIPKLNRIDRYIYHSNTEGIVNELKQVRALNIKPEDCGNTIYEQTETIKDLHSKITTEIELKKEKIRTGQIKGVLAQGQKKSKEQERIIQYLKHLSENGTYTDRAKTLQENLKKYNLKGTSEDVTLREIFRNEDKKFTDWHEKNFLDTLEQFMKEHLKESPEYQTTLEGASNVSSTINCWGIIGI